MIIWILLTQIRSEKETKIKINMCVFYKKITNKEQSNSPFPLITIEHRCSKIYTNELKQSVEIKNCSHHNQFENCKYFEKK